MLAVDTCVRFSIFYACSLFFWVLKEDCSIPADFFIVLSLFKAIYARSCRMVQCRGFSSKRSGGDKTLNFISSSEFNAYLKQIKVILSAVKNVFFFTSDEYNFILFHRSKQRLFYNLGLNFFQKNSGMYSSSLTLRYGSTHVK